MINKIATGLMATGTFLFLTGGASLDGPNWILGLITTFGGLGIGCIGYALKELGVFDENENDPGSGNSQSQ